jgi:hypothetical protein
MHAKGPYREVLDWLTDQVDRLDEHARELTEQAEQKLLSPEEIEARSRGIVEAGLVVRTTRAGVGRAGHGRRRLTPAPRARRLHGARARLHRVVHCGARSSGCMAAVRGSADDRSPG